MFKTKPEDALFKILRSLEPNAQREEGSIQYIIARKIGSDFVTGNSFPLVFNEIRINKVALETHCQHKEMVSFLTRNMYQRVD